ncbi:MAG: substrate-binding domain-containing protein [Candidatus Galacturonibacter soehngenii]|nr:substrate-binding domain-containing protein [Candidatus Galacturonibacter soehngenii]
MEERNLVIVLSDIHMGTNAPTVWYRKEIHEKYVVSVLNYIIDLAESIEEVVLLGDIFEFWSYPPEQLPPSIDDIIRTHPNILGKEGKLREALSALKGRMVFIPGDHDMNVTKADLDKLRTNDGYVMKYHYGVYVPIYDTHMQFMHGHECTAVNAPYFISHISPLPLGYFVTRAMAYKIHKDLMTTPNKSISDLNEYSSYSYNDFLPKLPFFYENFDNKYNTVCSFIDALINVTGMPGNLPIQINRFITVTLDEVKTIYQNKGILGHQIELSNILDDYNSMYVADSFLKKCCKESINIVVMGHTHAPMIYKNDYKHINTGYMCPPVSKLRFHPVTFGVFEILQRKFELIRVTGDKYIQITPLHRKNESNNIMKFKKKENNVEMKESILPPQKILTFGWSVFDASLEFWQTMQSGVVSKARELGINLLLNDEKSNSIEMVTGSIDMITQGIDALIIAPYNPELMPVVVENAQKYNIPVVAIDTGTGGANVAAFIVSDNFGGGVLAGEYALDLIEEYKLVSKNFAIIKVQQTAKYALLRGEGFEGVLTQAGYDLVAEVTANSIEEEAYVEMKKILMDYKDDLAIVFSENGTMALGAARAIVEAGKKGQILLIGFDAGPSILEAIKRGDMQGTIAQQPFRMGELGVEIAHTILLGEPVTFDDWQTKQILMEVFLVNEKGEFSRDVK